MRILATDDDESWAASPLVRLIRLLGLVLLAVLLAYWLIFAVYTIKNLILGGPHAVLAWYMHVDGGYLHIESDGKIIIPQWSAAKFVLQQGILLAVTVGLWFGVRPRQIGLKP
jgi:ABC-type nitrate/sulfonate/bicarbonate transport system permease component